MKKRFRRLIVFASAQAFVLFALMAIAPSASAQTVESLRVMSYNILVGGAAYGPLSRTVGVIQTAQADVIGIQEVRGSAQAIANSLGFYYHGFDSDLAIVSRYPITEVLSDGVKIQVSPGQEAYLFDVHLAPDPYEPYDIQDGSITTEAQAIASARSTRGGSLDNILKGTSSARATIKPVFLVGDFNEPSHLDWTQEAATAGLNFGMKVAWPASRAVASAGFADAFRLLRPDEIGDRGETWTTGYPAPFTNPGEVHDRIDFVYSSPGNVVPLSAQTIGYDANDGNTDIAIQPYPSDHRALVVEYDLPVCTLNGDISGNCSVGVEDWNVLRTNQHTDLSGLLPLEAFQRGDLNGDFYNDHADFVLFKQAYEDSHGAGSFAHMLAVPEPASSSLALLGLITLLAPARRRPTVRQCRGLASSCRCLPTHRQS